MVESTGASPTAGGSPSGPSVTTTTTNVVVQHAVIGYTIDTRAGFVDGNIQARDGVEPTTQLPSKKNPVVVFTGLSKDKKRALFLMTSSVAGTTARSTAWSTSRPASCSN